MTSSIRPAATSHKRAASLHAAYPNGSPRTRPPTSLIPTSYSGIRSVSRISPALRISQSCLLSLVRGALFSFSTFAVVAGCLARLRPLLILSLLRHFCIKDCDYGRSQPEARTHPSHSFCPQQKLQKPQKAAPKPLLKAPAILSA